MQGIILTNNENHGPAGFGCEFYIYKCTTYLFPNVAIGEVGDPSSLPPSSVEDNISLAWKNGKPPWEGMLSVPVYICLNHGTKIIANILAACLEKVLLSVIAIGQLGAIKAGFPAHKVC